MQVANELQGYVRVRITGYSPERFLNLCKHRQIEIWGLEAEGNGYEMYLTVRSFRKLKPLLRKTRTRIAVLERYGVPFFVHKYRRRKLMFLGGLLCVVLIFFLSRFIWKIDVRGNQSITDEVLLEYLETEQVHHGMRIREVDYEKIVKDIRKNFDEIIWVSASLEGCNLMIDVKENTDTFQVSQTEELPSDLISDCAAVITEMITRNGTPCVKVGDAVTPGQILVSGKVEVMNDAGEVVREDYRSADADILAEVELSYEDICANRYELKEYGKYPRRQVYLQMGDLRLSLGFNKAKKGNYEKKSKARQIIINESFELPIRYGVQEGRSYVMKEKQRSSEEKKKILADNLEWHCKELEESGATILEKNLHTQETAEGTKLSGTIKLRKAIGTPQKIG